MGLAAASIDSAHELRTCSNEDERQRRFGTTLRQFRMSIPFEKKSLGEFERLPNRVGRMVSQEELAEALGVSRTWYTMLESGRVGTSVALLDRLCKALAVDEPQRLLLIQLGIPKLLSLIGG